MHSSSSNNSDKTGNVLGNNEQLAVAILDTVNMLVVVLDREGRIVRFNRACRQLTGYKLEEVQGRVFWNFLILPEEKEGVESTFINLRAGHFPNSHTNAWIAKNGAVHNIAWDNNALLDDEGNPEFIIGTGIDITQSQRTKALSSGQTHLMELIAIGAPLKTIFDGIVQLIQSQIPSSIASIVVLDDDKKHIRHIASSSLPETYVKAIDGLAIGPKVGSCGTAICRKSMVVVEDISTDPLWEDYRDLALSHNLLACWSSPILARNGDALGAFATYYNTPNRPQAEDLAIIRAASHLAGVAIEKQKNEERLLAATRQTQQLATAIENLSTSVMITDATLHDNPVVFVNPAFAQITGYSSDEVMGRNCRFLQGPETDLEVVRTLRETIASGRSIRTTLLNYRKDGTPFHNQLTINPIVDEAGNVKNFVGLVEDITPIKQAEQELLAAKTQLEATVSQRTQQLQKELVKNQQTSEALRVSEAKFRSIVQTAIDGIVLADKRGIITDWNEGAATIFGYSRAEIIGQHATVLMPERFHESHLRAFNQVVAGGPFTLAGKILELTGKRKSGEEFPIELSLNSWLVDGEMYFSCFVRDVTERRHLLNRLNEEISQSWSLQEQLQLQIERMPIGYIVWDTQLRVQSWNPAAEEIFGYSEAEAFGRDVNELLVSPTYKNDLKELWQRLLQGDGAANSINQNITKSGEKIICQWANAPLKDSNGRVTGLLSMVQDITTRHEYETNLQHAKEEAERANVAKSEYLSRMSHELRTPLNAIIGFSQILEIEPLNELQEESVGHIRRAGDHLLSLINEVLDISKVEANRLELSLEPVNIDEALPSAIALVRDMAREKQIEIYYDENRSCDVSVMADRQRLMQVFINLLSNGIKYNRPGGRLTLSCKLIEDNVLVAFEDTGMGMSGEDLKKIFTPFERLNATKTGVEGTGLGLALSKSLVEAIHGSLTVESYVGQGSKFTVKLPHTKDEATEDTEKNIHPKLIEAPEEENSETAFPSSLVLFVEDNPSNYRLMQMMFKKRPQVRLLGATKGNIGLDLAIRHRPDLIFLDLNLPDIPGIEILEKLQQDASTASIPVVICSADATTTQIQRLKAAGAKDYLTKPFKLPDLLGILDEILNKENQRSHT